MEGEGCGGDDGDYYDIHKNLKFATIKFALSFFIP